MTAVPLFDRHHGKHCPPQRPSFFRRLVAAWRRKPSAPEAPLPSGAVTALLGSPVLGDRMIADVRREHDLLSATELAALEPRAVYSGPPIYAVRHDGLVRVGADNRVEVLPAPLAWDARVDTTASLPAVGDGALEAERDAARAAGLRARAAYEPPAVELLQQLLEGVRAL